MKQIRIILLLVQIGISANADSDFFNSSSSVPAEMFAGQKPKPEPVAGAPVAEAVAAPSKAVAPVGKPAKKVDMPREVFVEWIDGDEVAAEKPAEDERAPSGAAKAAVDSKSKRAAPEPKDIDQLLEQELKKSGSKKDSSEDEEHRFIEVN